MRGATWMQHPSGFERAGCPGASCLSAARTKARALTLSLTTVLFGFQKIGLDGSNLNQLDQLNAVKGWVYLPA